jgi:hypothetical protein
MPHLDEPDSGTWKQIKRVHERRAHDSCNIPYTFQAQRLDQRLAT